MQFLAMLVNCNVEISHDARAMIKFVHLEAAVIGTVLQHVVSSSRWLCPRDTAHRVHKMHWRRYVNGHLAEEFSSPFYLNRLNISLILDAQDICDRLMS